MSISSPVCNKCDKLCGLLNQPGIWADGRCFVCTLSTLLEEQNARRIKIKEDKQKEKLQHV